MTKTGIQIIIEYLQINKRLPKNVNIKLSCQKVIVNDPKLGTLDFSLSEKEEELLLSVLDNIIKGKTN